MKLASLIPRPEVWEGTRLAVEGEEQSRECVCVCVVYTMLHVCLDMVVTRNDTDRPVAMKIFQFDVHLCPFGD